MRKKTVIFGGTFNPIHRGHISMAEFCLGLDFVDEVLLVPDKAPVHKDFKGLLEPELRLEMCRIASEIYDNISVWDVEIRRDTKSYTYLTLKDFKREFPDKEPILLCGGDMITSFDTWYEYREILKETEILAVFRKGQNKQLFLNAVEGLKAKGGKITVLEVEPPEISSSEIRRDIALGKDVSSHLDRKVLDFISNNNLYV